MRNILFVFFLAIAISGFVQAGNINDRVYDIRNSAGINTSENVLPIIGDTLIAMEIVHENSKNPYEKYGYEFSGHCYACDVAEILITKQELTLIHACDPDVILTFVCTAINEEDNKVIVHSGNIKFIFEKIEESPIYKLLIEGSLGVEENIIRIGIYYTTTKSLRKFNTYDCGDFGG